MFHRNPVPPLTRRESIRRIGAGFGSLGLAGVMTDGGMFPRAAAASAAAASPLAPSEPHFTPKAKHVIHLFMPGGPSQVDTFDYKPLLAKHAGERPQLVDRKSLRNTKMGLMPSPFGFKRYGESGKMVSDIFPKTGECVDDISFIHSMHTDIPEHAGAMLMTTLGVCPRNQVDLVSVGTMLYMRFNRKRISSVAVIGFTDGQEVSEVDSGSAVAVAAVASRMAC